MNGTGKTDMNEILIVVDDTSASRWVVSSFHNLVQKPRSVTLLYVQRLEGSSLLIDMLGEAEMSTLKEAVKESEHKARLDEKAETVLKYYGRQIAEGSGTAVKPLVRAGHPAEEILKAAEEENVNLIIMAGDEKRGLSRFVTGSFVKQVQAGAKVPVLVARRANICEAPYTWRDAFAAISVTTVLMAGLYFLGVFLNAGKFQH